MLTKRVPRQLDLSKENRAKSYDDSYGFVENEDGLGRFRSTMRRILGAAM